MRCTFYFISFLRRAFCYDFVCFSLSLSLSFSLLIKAPKKSVPSKNSIRHGSSSSSFPSDSVRFCNEKTRNNFFDNFSERAIHSECQVILSDFLDTPLPSAISS